jgi:hypothetical protein
MQPDPDQVDQRLGVTDPSGQGHREGWSICTPRWNVITDLPMSIVRQRLSWLIGMSWQLHDVRPA